MSPYDTLWSSTVRLHDFWKSKTDPSNSVLKQILYNLKPYLSMADTHLSRRDAVYFYTRVCVYAAVLVWGFMLQPVSMTLSFPWAFKTYKSLNSPTSGELKRACCFWVPFTPALTADPLALQRLMDFPDRYDRQKQEATFCLLNFLPHSRPSP